MIETKGFQIHFSGDPSVGIFDADWEIAGPFIFDCEEDFEAFKEELLGAFGYVADRPCLCIATFEEIDAEIAAEERLYESMLAFEKAERG